MLSTLKRKRPQSGRPRRRKSRATLLLLPLGQQRALYPVAPPYTGKTRDLPLGDGREFVFTLPENKIHFAEVKRIALHLATMAVDLDLANPEQLEFLALIKPTSNA